METIIAALDDLRTAAQANRDPTSSPEYRAAKRDERAVELALNIITLLNSKLPPAMVADMMRRLGVSELENATTEGIRLATNAANAVRV